MTDYAEGSESASELIPRNRLEIPEGSTSPAFDAVQRPAHYASGAIECADAIAVAIADEPDAFVAWCRGNAIKYLWRAGKKDAAAQDLRKAIWYITRAAEKLEARDA